MQADLVLLERIAHEILDVLRASPSEVHRLASSMANYHGFGKIRFPAELLARVPSLQGVDPADIQSELVRVSRDLTREVHYHERSFAYVIVLGPAERLPKPRRAQAFIDGEWKGVTAGQKVEIPPGTPHGFTVGELGILYFLSVQSPPIVAHDGHDDYHRLEPRA